MYQKVLIETQFFPPIRLFAEAIQAEELIIEAHENYQKRSFRNRAYIATSQGRKLLSVPLEKGKNNKLTITKATISYEDDWQKDMVQTIYTAYHNAPYFMYYGSEIERLLQVSHKSLWELNNAVLSWCLETLDVDIPINHSTEYRSTPSPETKDLRGRLKPTDRFWNETVPVTYRQVHEDRTGFLPHMSIIDLIMCLGPESIMYLREVAAIPHD